MCPSTRTPSLRFLYNHAAHLFLHRNPTVSLSLLDQLFDRLPAPSQPWFVGPLLREREKDIEGLRRKSLVLWISCLVCQFGDLYREQSTETSESIGKSTSKPIDERARDTEGLALFGQIRKRCLDIYQPSPSSSASISLSRPSPTKNGHASLVSSSSHQNGPQLNSMMTINTTIDTPFALPPSIIHPLLLSAQTLYLDPSVLLQTLIEPFLQTIPLALTNTLAALSRSRASAEGMRARSLGEEGWVGDVLEGYQDVMSAWARCLGGERGKAVVREDRILGKEFKEQIIESLNPPSPLPSPVLSRLPSFDRTSSIDRASSPTPSDSSASSITSVQTTTPTSYRLQRQHTTNRDKESGNEAGKGKGKGRAKAGTVKSRWNGLDSGVEGLSGDESYEEEQNLEKVHLSTAQKIPFSSTSSSATNPITDKLAHEESRQDEGRTSYTSTSFGSKLVLLQKFLQPRSSSSPLPETLPASPMRHSLSKQSSTDLMNPNSYLLIFLRAIKSSFKAGLFLWIIWHIIYRVRAGWFRPSSVPSMTSAGGGVVSGVGRAEEIRRRLRRGILARF